MPETKITIELLTAAADGDRRAQHTLYKYCFSLLMPVCFRYTKNEEFAREELSQAFVKIIFGLKKYNPEVVFDAWARKITVNSVIDNYRKNKKHLHHDDVDDVITEYKIKQHSNPTEDKMGYDEIIELLEQVPEKSRMVFNLYVIEGYNHKEIADMLGLSEGTSKWHLSTARKLMQDLIKSASKTLMSIFL